MTLTVPLVEMHGTHNRFFLLDARTAAASVPLDELARTACAQAFGGGADGLLVVEPSSKADAKMRIFNADGSEAEMCANGLRCVTRYLAETGGGTEYSLETRSRIAHANIIRRSPEFLVRVNLGAPRFLATPLAMPHATFVSLGNPHIVVFEEKEQLALERLGAELNAVFPEGVNVHAARADGNDRFSVGHYERGVGVTASCGSGAVAVACAAIRQERASSPVTIVSSGGSLEVEWDGAGEAFLSGPAERVGERNLILNTSPSVCHAVSGVAPEKL